MQEFRRDDADYLSWLEHHPNGYVVNIHTRGKNHSVIHSARCGHLYPPEEHKTHTVSYGKACSENKPELVRWATANGHTLDECTTCNP
jgi:hypothetical protein